MTYNMFLQAWGGVFYLLNKIFFSRAERCEGEKKRIWMISSWAVYLIGMPAWVYIFVSGHNWMAACVEAGGALSMILGLVTVIKKGQGNPKLLDRLALIAAIVGIAISLYDIGFFARVTQYPELGVVIGFLGGTYLLARQRSSGYIWFMLMIFSNAILMGMKENWWLVAQQIISLGFIIDAYVVSRKKNS